MLKRESHSCPRSRVATGATEPTTQTDQRHACIRHRTERHTRPTLRASDGRTASWRRPCDPCEALTPRTCSGRTTYCLAPRAGQLSNRTSGGTPPRTRTQSSRAGVESEAVLIERSPADALLGRGAEPLAHRRRVALRLIIRPLRAERWPRQQHRGRGWSGTMLRGEGHGGRRRWQRRHPPPLRVAESCLHARPGGARARPTAPAPPATNVSHTPSACGVFDGERRGPRLLGWAPQALFCRFLLVRAASLNTRVAVLLLHKRPSKRAAAHDPCAPTASTATRTRRSANHGGRRD